MNYENMSVDTNAGIRFYPCTWIQARSGLENSMEGKTARDKEVEERRDGRKIRSSGVRGTNPLSLHASLYATLLLCIESLLLQSLAPSFSTR